MCIYIYIRNGMLALLVDIFSLCVRSATCLIQKPINCSVCCSHRCSFCCFGGLAESTFQLGGDDSLNFCCYRRRHPLLLLFVSTGTRVGLHHRQAHLKRSHSNTGHSNSSRSRFTNRGQNEVMRPIPHYRGREQHLMPTAGAAAAIE